MVQITHKDERDYDGFSSWFSEIYSLVYVTFTEFLHNCSFLVDIGFVSSVYSYIAFTSSLAVVVDSY